MSVEFVGDYNVNGITDNHGHLSYEKELAEYFIQFRNDDLIDIQEKLYFDVDINEHSIINIILNESKNGDDFFRDILRDGVTLAVMMMIYEKDDLATWSIQSRLLRNKIRINFTIQPNINIKQLTASDYEGEIVTFEAMINNWSKAKTITHIALYKCPECGHTITRKYQPKIKDMCPDDKVKYEFDKPILSEDTRRIILKENINDFSEGKLPFSITADIYGKTVLEVELSDKVIVTGIFRSVRLTKENGKISQEFIPTIQVISIQNKKRDQVEIPDMALLKKLKDLEYDGKLVGSIIDGFAYNIYMKKMEKKAVICSLIGSKWIGQVGKGNPPMIHILFVGDPDTYKSTIMKYIVNVSDNCVIADSTTVSNAGLKAIAVKMDDGRWSIMAGLIPTHSGGCVFLDEFGDLKPDAYADLKAPMIDGRVTKNVGGENFSGIAETAILASMNPIEGVYDDAKTIYENLSKLEKPLITRFDIIFKFSKLSQDYDSTRIREHFKKCDLYGKPKELLTDNEIKLFINYVKDLKVELTEDALDRCGQFFAEIEKKKKDEEGYTGMETRAENAVIKFAVAIAKWHMSNMVTAAHVDEALKLCAAGLGTFNKHLEDGEFINERSLQKTTDGRTTAIKNAYDKLKDEDGYAFKDEIITEALTYNCFSNRNQADAFMGKLYLEKEFTEKNKMIKIDWK